MVAVTDYCTGWLEGWWSGCCQAHDLAYLEQAGRSAADVELALCVARTLPELALAYPALASVAGALSVAVAGGMYLGVRLFGRWFYRRAGAKAREHGASASS